VSTAAPSVRGAYWALPLDGARWGRRLPDGYEIAPAWRPDAELLAGAMELPARVIAERFRRGAAG
jgi:hypothetical protein